MKIGLWSGLSFNTYDDLLESAASAVENGFDSVWLPQTLAVDSVSALAVIASHHPDLHVGVAVTPMQSRSPLSSYLAARGLGETFGSERIALGLGASHPGVSEAHYGFDHSEAVAFAGEYLSILSDLRNDATSGAVSGRFFEVDITLPAAAVTSRVLLAALGPKMLRLAAQHCDGTVTWMTGPRTLESHTAPRLFGAGEELGRHDLELVACLPVCVTDDAGAARTALRDRMQGALGYPSYRRQIDREGVNDVAGIGLIGDEAQVMAELDHLGEIGVTELVFDIFGSEEEMHRTRSFVRASRTDAVSGS